MWEVDKLPRVLVVEDAPFLRYAFSRLLRLQGFEVLEANDGLEALEVIEKFDPQLILTDLMMPVMDGVELIRHLKSDPKTARLPIIAITADSSGISEKRAREAGADAFITKPVELPALLDQLRTVEARPISLPSIGSETPFSLPNSPSL